MAYPKDLREVIQRLEKTGEVKKVEGVDPNVELGTLTELMAEKQGPALLFDKIKGFPEGYRVLSNPYVTANRTALIIDMPPNLKPLEYIKRWKEKLKEFKSIPPKEVETGPVKENIQTGEEIDLEKFPTPTWHELDGGPFIGTGCLIVTKDPDTGAVNLGTYRVQVHDKKTCGIHISPSHHGMLDFKKWWAKGLSAPVIVVAGQDPATYFASTYSLSHPPGEYDFAGWVQGEPVEVIIGEHTGLPFPATAEIAIEGEVPPYEVENRTEGPFGEYTGYYGSGARPENVIRVKAVLHRDNPIIQGDPPLKPPLEHYGIPIMNAPNIWDQLEKAGVPGIAGVYCLPAGGGVALSVVAIKQMYGGHAKQAGLVAMGCHSGASTGRFVIVVDDDIDPSNTEEVMWAVATRCDPATTIDIVKSVPSSPLDPRLTPEQREKMDYTNTRAIINACRPYEWIKEFPAVNIASEKVKNETLAKWRSLFSEVSNRT